MKPELGPTPDEIAKAKLAAFHDAQNAMRRELAIKEASVFTGPELSRNERRRQTRNNKRILKGLRP